MYAVGADRHITNNLVSGALVSLIKYQYNALQGSIKNQASGLNIGPYFGYSISQALSISSSLTYGKLQNSNAIAFLTSQYRSQVYHLDLRATGVYELCGLQVRLKPLISLTHFRNPPYELNGVFNGRPFQIDRPRQCFNFNFAEFKLEGNYRIDNKKGDIIQLYLEPGINYAFSRPNEGQILTSNLELASTKPTTETITLGIRSLLAKAFLIDASGSYLTVANHYVDVWQFRILASYSFD